MAQDDAGQRRALRVERAILKARSLFPSFASRKEQALIDDRDPNNAAAILGEYRALFGLADVFGRNIETPESGSDFIVAMGTRLLRVEVVTPTGSTKKREEVLGVSSARNIAITTTDIAPFGHPTDDKPGDTIQGNAVSRLSALKQSEHQADTSVPSVLWVDFDNDRAFPVSIGASQSQPFISGNEGLVSGAAWWANYGEIGDPIYDRWSFVTGEQRSYIMQFNGRFRRASRYLGVINAIDDDHILHQNPTAATPLEACWVMMLLALPGVRFEHWWADWPIQGTLAAKVEAAQRTAHALLDSRQPEIEEAESGDAIP